MADETELSEQLLLVEALLTTMLNAQATLLSRALGPPNSVDAVTKELYEAVADEYAALRARAGALGRPVGRKWLKPPAA